CSSTIPAPSPIYTLSLHDALPIFRLLREHFESLRPQGDAMVDQFYSLLFSRHPEIRAMFAKTDMEAQRKKFFETLDEIVRHLERSEEHTSELQSLRHLVCRLLLEK